MPISAKGIPDRSSTGDVTTLPLYTPLEFVRQLHKAKRAGLHEDFRIGNAGGMYSFALRKGLPTEPGQRRLAVTQPLHNYSYNNFEGKIGKGYGEGVVKRIDKGEIVLLDKTPNKLTFTRGDRRNSPIYTMIKTKNGNWITILQKEDQPPEIAKYEKQHFKGIPLSQVADEMDRGAIATPKIDGGGSIATVKPHSLEVYSIRRDKDGSLIRYTDHIGNLRGLNNPKDTVGKSFRAEIFAEQNGKVLPPYELGALLNSTLVNAIRKKRSAGIKLKLAALATLKGKNENYLDKDALERLTEKLALPNVFVPPVYRTSGEALQALQQMRSGEHPLTEEGLVLVNKNGTPLKAKITNDADVVIRNIFPAVTKGTPRAGGFEYSLPGSNKVVGRTGTGFNHKTLVDMLNNPDSYIGQLAKIKTRGQFKSGAYRAPSFISLRVD